MDCVGRINNSLNTKTAFYWKLLKGDNPHNQTKNLAQNVLRIFYKIITIQEKKKPT